MDSLNEWLENKRLIEAIRNKLEDCDGEWFTEYLPYAIGTLEGRSVNFTVERGEVNSVAGVLLHRRTDYRGRSVKPTQQQIQNAQDNIIDWVDYI